MKNKGFTLIELLAVIVILAIIALIATPMILGVIDTAKKGSAESAALGYIDAVEKTIMLSQFKTTGAITIPAENTVLTVGADGKLSGTGVTAFEVELKGEAPKQGSTVTVKKSGEVTAISLEFEKVYSGHRVTLVNGKALAS